MATIIAYCGLDCAQCEAYQATQAGDEAWKQRVLDQWRAEYGMPQTDLAAVTCDGCLGAEGRKCGHCAECGIRACAVEHGLENCGYCGEYESCTTIADLLKFVPTARATLDEIHSGLC